MAEPYTPRNGSEGEGFFEAFCYHCARDKAFRDTDYLGDPALGCQILARSYTEQQKEWVEDEQGPRCTAFTADPTLPERCQATPDMFALQEKQP
jgi:hypothetical protein